MKFFSLFFATPVYFALTFITLVVWDPLLKLVWAFSPAVHKTVMDSGIGLLVRWLSVLGSKPKITFHTQIAPNQPILFVSNHQSELDIPLLMWFLKDYHPLFVAKKELGAWVPSVSHTLRVNGSILIDRKNPAQAIPLLKSLGERISAHRYSGCIFPEGTRSRDGKLKKFKVAGAAAILEAANPPLLVVPVCINGSAELIKRGLFPLPLGLPIGVEVLPPVCSPEEAKQAPEKALELCQQSIGAALK